ncbi:MAG: DNA mismatch repair endonuclease MutL [Eubacteriales bacterium]|nr:DNA mismatch repair endonuclease MutL [Eubacteriales bacterium]
MGKINVLSFEIANLIAAGEVVDRPASVLKELLENSIDAGATKIKAEIRAGGVRLIRVTDNGCGMDSADLPMAIKRHATSKISSRDDLNGIMTLGFRGEALAATASVSRMTIISKTAKAPMGTMLSADGGTINEVCEVGCADGTSVMVENLFANVPARRKFLKKDATEMLACSAVVEKVAMSRPNIAFEFVSDGIVRFSTAGDGKLINVLYSIEGADFAKKLLLVDNNDCAMRVSGYVGRSDNVRGNRNYENTFINGRYVKSKTVTAALEQAFASYIAPGKFPVSTLFIDINPALVDVNVHPAKLEVKFSDERKVFEAVYYAVKTVLGNAQYRPEMSIGRERTVKRDFCRSFVPLPENNGNTLTPRQSLDLLSHYAGANDKTSKDIYANDLNCVNGLNETKRDAVSSGSREKDDAMHFSKKTTDGGHAKSDAEQFGEHVKSDAVRFGSGVFDSKTSDGFKKNNLTASPFPYSDEDIRKYDVYPNRDVDKKTESDNFVGDAKTNSATIPRYKYVGEIFNCYLIVEIENKVLIIDKHAAHERINFEKMKKQLLSDGRIASQGLMIPIELDIGGTVAADISEQKEEFLNIGYDFSIKENKKIILSSVPDNMSPDAAADAFGEIAKRLSEGTGSVSLTDSEMRERALYQIACKASVKGGRVYDDAHIIWLIEKVLSMPDIKVCPHGRPIAMEMRKSELDRKFDRLK